MSLPPQKEIELPLLFEIEAMGGQAKPQDLYPRVTAHFPQLSDEGLEARLPGSGNKWTNRIQFARQRLVENSEIDKSVPGLWRITPKGKSHLAASNVPPPATYPFVWEKGRVARKDGPRLSPTPPDELEKLVREITERLEKLAELAKKPPETPRLTHDEVVERVKEIGEVLGRKAEVKWGPVYKHDCVWKDNPYTNPKLVVEVCDKGNLDKDIAALNWAVRTWGAKAILVTFEESDFEAAQRKLAPESQIYALKVDDVLKLHSLLKAGNLQAVRSIFGI